jgi:orotate phosphoribosyltransferase
MDDLSILNLLKESGAMLEGHFLLSSGRHSDRYFQCAKLLQYPDKAEAALSGVASRLRADIDAGVLAVDAVVGPALGGIIAAYELGRQLGLPAFFTERVDSGVMALRRGFDVGAGMRLLIAEDVITTAKSSMETARVLESFGGVVTALACVVDRRASDTPPVPLPVYAAARLEAASWDADNCELCAQGIPAVKPGSRKVV